MGWLYPKYDDLPEASRHLLRRQERLIWLAALEFIALFATIDIGLEPGLAALAARQYEILARLFLVILSVLVTALVVIRLLLSQAAQHLRTQEQSARLAGALLAARTAQHYVNNQLALTVGYSELLANHPKLPDQLRDLATRALEGAQAAAKTVQTMQELTSLEPAEELAGPPVLDLERSTVRANSSAS